MGTKGKETPDPIKKFIIMEKRNSPGLTQVQLAARVEGNFGQSIDKSTVGRILRPNSDQSNQDGGNDEQAGSPENAPDLESHRRELYYFGQRLRDRLELLAPHQALVQWKATSEEAGLA